jgi:hypothetical protein
MRFQHIHFFFYMIFPIDLLLDPVYANQAFVDAILSSQFCGNYV